MRIDLDDATLARLAPIAAARGDTLQELAATIIAAWRPREGELPIASAPGDGPSSQCEQCGAPRTKREGARGLCGSCYYRRHRAAKLAGTWAPIARGGGGHIPPSSRPTVCTVCAERLATHGGRCERCYHYYYRRGHERPSGIRRSAGLAGSPGGWYVAAQEAG